MAGCSVCSANCLTLHQHQKSLESHSLMCQPLFTKTPWRQRTRTSLPPLQQNLHLLKSSWWLLVHRFSLWALPVSVLYTICTRCFRFPAVRLNIPRDWLGWKLYKTWIKVISFDIVYTWRTHRIVIVVNSCLTFGFHFCDPRMDEPCKVQQILAIYLGRFHVI